jgi:hypothetical protein
MSQAAEPPDISALMVPKHVDPPVEPAPTMPQVPADMPAPPPPVATPTPPEYIAGAVKQNPDTLSVAVRTDLVDADNSHDWGVMTIEHGGHYTTWDEVSSWDDLTKATP